MARLSAAFVVDADPKGLDALAYGFEGEGCRITASDRYEIKDAAESTPQLVVVAVREPPDAAVAFVRSIRNGAAGAPTPVLILGPPTLREEIRSIPGVEFLPLPVFVRDVLTASRILVAGHDVGGPTGEDRDINGALSEYGLFYIVRTMIGLGRSGILTVERATRRGEIRFSDGEVTAVQVGSLHGSAALHQLLLWEEAALDLKLRSSVHRGSLKQASEDLLDEAERFLRDFAHASRSLGPTSTIFDADQAKAKNAGASIPSEVVPLLKLFDGQRSLGDVIEDSPFRVFDTIRIVARLVDLGILLRKVGTDKGTVSTAIKSPLLEEWLKPGTSVVPASPRTSAPPKPVAPKDARVVAGSKEQRGGLANRRKQRRDRSTLEQGTLANLTPGRAPVVVGGAAHSAQPSVDDPAADTQESPTLDSPTVQQASGASVIPSPQVTADAPAEPVRAQQAAETPAAEVRPSGLPAAMARGELRSSRPEAAPPVAASPSVMLDLDAGEKLAAAAPTAPPPARVVLRPAPRDDKAQTVGSMQARPSATMNTAASPSSGSIELDPELMADLAAIEQAAKAAVAHVEQTPLAPAISAQPMTAPPAAPTTQVVHAGADAHATPPPAANGAEPHAPAPAPETQAPPVAAEHRRASRRPSNEFNALEKDFFAREADLYKDDKADNFEDLDHQHPRRPR